MAEIALIRAGVVEAVIVADIAFAQTLGAEDAVDVSALQPRPGVGWGYSSGAFVEPPAPPVVPQAPVDYGRIVTRLAFLNRFTDAEAVGIDLASVGVTAAAAGLRRAQNKINAAEEIQLDNPETRAGVMVLETAGLLAVGRAAEILDTAVAAGEVPARYRSRYGLPEVPA